MELSEEEFPYCPVCDNEVRYENYSYYCPSCDCAYITANWHLVEEEDQKMSQIKLEKPDFRLIPAFTRTANYVVDIPLDYLEEAITRYVKNYELNLDPDFQRAHVWNESQQISYVEYILRGGISARTLYFNYPGWMRSWEGL